MNKPVGFVYGNPVRGQMIDGEFCPYPDTPDNRVIHPESLAQLRNGGGTWAVYQNHDLGHSEVGRLQFLKVGDGCTFATAPARMPDSHLGIGWRYLLVGYARLSDGAVVEDVEKNLT